MAGPLAWDPTHWAKRAEEMRALAATITDETARKQMLDIAAGYDKLADRAEARSVVKAE